MRRTRSSRFGLSLATIGVLSLFLLAESRPASAEPPPGPAGWLFDPGTVVEIDLELPQESIDVLEVEPEEAYQPATFSLTAGQQTYGPLEVGARLKGGLGSFRPLSQKAAFKLKFDELVEDQSFFGLEKLTLNNMAQDPTMIHEALAYESFRALGIPASRTGYAWVKVNGEPYGLYLNIEVLDAISLPRWFGSTRHLYEGSYGTDVTPGAAALFEVDEGKKSKREDLEALIAAANAGEGDWSDGIAAVADLEQMTRMWAVERYIGHWDGYAGHGAHLAPNNYYLHSGDTGADAGIFRMLPWGTDWTWETRLGFGQKGGFLLDRCLADASCAATYREALVETGAGLSALDLESRTIELAATVAPWQALELTPRREHSPAEALTAIASMRAFIADRPAELAEWLNPPPADPIVALAAAAGAAASHAAPAAAASTELWVGASRGAGRTVATPVELRQSGAVLQRVSAWIRGRLVTVCVDRESRGWPGPLMLRCELSARALRRLTLRPLALAIGVDFVSVGGNAETAVRRLTLPKR